MTRPEMLAADHIRELTQRYTTTEKRPPGRSASDAFLNRLMRICLSREAGIATSGSPGATRTSNWIPR